MRPVVFIGSASSEDRMRITRALAHRLQKDFGIIPKVWTYAFPPSESTLNSLIVMSQDMDFAVFVLGPDDQIMKSPTDNPEGKGEPVEGETWAPRDNVIFEMGLLIGTLTKERCFTVLPQIPRLLYSDNRRRLHLLTDYLGTNYCTYIATKEPDLDPLDAVFAACQEIGNQIDKLGPREINAFRALFGTKKAVVVYPHITAKTDGVSTTVHKGSAGDCETIHWEDPNKEDPNKLKEQEIAHFDDLRAVNAIAELCGRMHVNVIATTDGQEQAEVQSPDTISFSIGLLNGLTLQAFEIIARDTEKLIRIDRLRNGDKPGSDSEIVFNLDRYPKVSRDSRHPTLPPDKGQTDADKKETNRDFAIIVRTFLRGGGTNPILRYVCSGIEGPGTAVAGVYLKNHWKEILKYYEEFGKDLEQDSLALMVEFWGRKAESARPEVIRLCFFQPGRCEFHSFNRITKRWEPEERQDKPKKPT